MTRPFPFVLEDYRKAFPFTVAEQAMMMFVDRVTDKPGWHEKVFDDEIVAKWRIEVADMAKAARETPPYARSEQEQQEQDKQEEKKTKHNPTTAPFVMRKGFSDKMFNYCIAELRHKAKIFERVGFVEVLETFASIFKADGLVPGQLRNGLLDAVKPLEDIPDKDKDWHPGSDGKVLDLVHPSLFPYVEGRTWKLADEIALADTLGSIGSGDVKTVPDGLFVRHELYQWLPAEVDVYDDGTATFVSYINNLHPRHKDLYAVLGQLVSKFVPMWAATYQRAVDGQNRIEVARIKDPCATGIVCHMSTKCYDCWELEAVPKGWRPGLDAVERHPSVKDADCEGEKDRVDGNDSGSDGSDAESEESQDLDEFKEEALERHTILQPEPNEFEPEPEESIATTFLSHGPWFKAHKVQEPSTAPSTTSEEPASPAHRLQVIVKLANIHLTPENPTYGGGSWHIEGQLGERICATGIYYYDEDNTTASYLGFRTGVDTEDWRGTHVLDHREFMAVYPVKNSGTEYYEDGGDVVFDLGAVHTRQGRLLTFPNVIQHCVQPFELKDKSKAGHRKIVAFFLVDPATPIISTAHVPPQQRHWADHSQLPDKLPTEVKEMITAHLECPYGWDEAAEYRLELMKRRSLVNEWANEEIYRGAFNLCEH
ncbi:hypothetical protein Q8F55_004428 [Vanrija albida]|uniref:Fe2OG dioxygenase domain-containing protein n=1 Tax=Vanrija albida TaxID=181172 RepID=A0ABR3Q7C7_9TREE